MLHVEPAGGDVTVRLDLTRQHVADLPDAIFDLRPTRRGDLDRCGEGSFDAFGRAAAGDVFPGEEMEQGQRVRPSQDACVDGC